MVLGADADGTGTCKVARALLEWGFAAWDSRRVLPAGQILADAQCSRVPAPAWAWLLRAIYVTLPKGSAAPVTMRVRYAGPLGAPIAQGAEVARLELRVGSQPPAELPGCRRRRAARRWHQRPPAQWVVRIVAVTARSAGRGRFIALEGGEGAGKSTQARLCRCPAEFRDGRWWLTREPGGTAGAEAIRALLLDPRGDGWNPRAEALLFAAARSDHVERLIAPALARGQWVICDRYLDSSRATKAAAVV